MIKHQPSPLLVLHPGLPGYSLVLYCLYCKEQACHRKLHIDRKYLVKLNSSRSHHVLSERRKKKILIRIIEDLTKQTTCRR